MPEENTPISAEAQVESPQDSQVSKEQVGRDVAVAFTPDIMRRLGATGEAGMQFIHLMIDTLIAAGDVSDSEKRARMRQAFKDAYPTVAGHDDKMNTLEEALNKLFPGESGQQSGEAGDNQVEQTVSGAFTDSLMKDMGLDTEARKSSFLKRMSAVYNSPVSQTDAQKRQQMVDLYKGDFLGNANIEIRMRAFLEGLNQLFADTRELTDSLERAIQNNTDLFQADSMVSSQLHRVLTDPNTSIFMNDGSGFNTITLERRFSQILNTARQKHEEQAGRAYNPHDHDYNKKVEDFIAEIFGEAPVNSAESEDVLEVNVNQESTRNKLGKFLKGVRNAFSKQGVLRLGGWVKGKLSNFTERFKRNSGDTTPAEPEDGSITTDPDDADASATQPRQSLAYRAGKFVGGGLRRGKGVYDVATEKVADAARFVDTQTGANVNKLREAFKEHKDNKSRLAAINEYLADSAWRKPGADVLKDLTSQVTILARMNGEEIQDKERISDHDLVAVLLYGDIYDSVRENALEEVARRNIKMMDNDDGQSVMAADFIPQYHALVEAVKNKSALKNLRRREGAQEQAEEAEEQLGAEPADLDEDNQESENLWALLTGKARRGKEAFREAWADRPRPIGRLKNNVREAQKAKSELESLNDRLSDTGLRRPTEPVLQRILAMVREKIQTPNLSQDEMSNEDLVAALIYGDLEPNLVAEGLNRLDERNARVRIPATEHSKWVLPASKFVEQYRTLQQKSSFFSDQVRTLDRYVDTIDAKYSPILNDKMKRAKEAILGRKDQARSELKAWREDRKRKGEIYDILVEAKLLTTDTQQLNKVEDQILAQLEGDEGAVDWNSFEGVDEGQMDAILVTLYHDFEEPEGLDEEEKSLYQRFKQAIRDRISQRGLTAKDGDSYEDVLKLVDERIAIMDRGVGAFELLKKMKDALVPPRAREMTEADVLDSRLPNGKKRWLFAALGAGSSLLLGQLGIGRQERMVGSGVASAGWLAGLSLLMIGAGRVAEGEGLRASIGRRLLTALGKFNDNMENVGFFIAGFGAETAVETTVAGVKMIAQTAGNAADHFIMPLIEDILDGDDIPNASSFSQEDASRITSAVPTPDQYDVDRVHAGAGNPSQPETTGVWPNPDADLGPGQRPPVQEQPTPWANNPDLDLGAGTGENAGQQSAQPDQAPSFDLPLDEPERGAGDVEIQNEGVGPFEFPGEPPVEYKTYTVQSGDTLTDIVSRLFPGEGVYGSIAMPDGTVVENNSNLVNMLLNNVDVFAQAQGEQAGEVRELARQIQALQDGSPITPADLESRGLLDEFWKFTHDLPIGTVLDYQVNAQP